MERNVLGRGLSALIPEGPQEKEKIVSLAIEKMRASDFQPRKYFSEARLRELADSIKEKGIIQPILVRPKGDSYEIIAGERRFRAAQLLGYKEVPALVKNVGDGDVLELSLIENIQREELNRMEEARAYKRLSGEFRLTHEDIAKRVSKDRATVSNTMRLLDLPEKIQDFIEENTISMGHAKCLIALENDKAQLKLCQKIINKGLSVRQTELLARAEQGDKPQAKKKPRNGDVFLANLEQKLQRYLGTRVRIQQGKKRGKIQIEYFSTEDLNRILELFPGLERA